MKHQHDFQAERMVANHCEELMARSAPRFDRAEAAQSLFERLCSDLSERLRGHLVGPRPVISGDAGSSQTGDALMRGIGRKAANYLTKLGPVGPTLLISFDLANATKLTDRLFGGDGGSPKEEPETLTLSTSLTLQHLARSIAQGFATSANLHGQTPEIQHDSDVARLAPFERNAYCFAWSIAIAQGDLGPWNMAVALPESELDALLAGQDSHVAADTQSSDSAAAFDPIPLPVAAVLTQVTLPLGRLTTLQAGDVLPIAPARRVPLLIDGVRIAEGRIGTRDDRVALQITQSYQSRTT